MSSLSVLIPSTSAGKINQTRQEEAKGGAAAERGKGCAFVGLKRADAFIAADQGAALGEVELAPALEAPGVEADRQIIGEKIRAGEVEVDDA